MAQHLYALLVGIDEYPASVTSLRGCVSDTAAIATYLSERVNRDGYELHLQTLQNEAATRQAVIDGFRHHLSQVSKDDIVLFSYSGHGSWEEAPPEWWRLEPDRRYETLVCWDSRNDGGWDLADKELAQLIAEVADKGPQITVILDCCHSGSGTREELPEVRVRHIPPDPRDRPLSSYLVPFETSGAPQLTRSFPGENSAGAVISQGRHVLLAACHESETAKEYAVAGNHHGAFSYFLMETLRTANGSLTYRNLFKRADVLIRNQVISQSPQLEATHPEDLDRPFLGGAIAHHSPYFTLYHHTNYGWVIEGGAVHGIPTPSGQDTTQLAVFPLDSTPEQLRQRSAAIAQASVVEVLPQLSRVGWEGEVTLDPATTYKAVVTSLPLSPIGVYLEGEPAGVEFVRQAIAPHAGQSTSLYVRKVDQRAEAELRVVSRDGQYWITRAADERPLTDAIAGFNPESALRIVYRLEHIARWLMLLKLTAPAASRLLPDAVRMEIYQNEQPMQAAPIRLEYQNLSGQWRKPTFQIKLTNTSDEALYCTVLVLTELFAVQTSLFPAGGVWLQPGEEAWAAGGRRLNAELPQELWQQGITEYKDILKLMVSTVEFDPRLLAQGNLDAPSSATITTRGQATTALGRLLQREQTRTVTIADAEDWTTSQVALLIVRPLDGAAVAKERTTDLGAGVQLLPHPTLQAQARLTTQTQASRDLGTLALPALLRDFPKISQPLQLSPSRGTDPGLSVLELGAVDPATFTAVTARSPLRLTLDAELGTEEHLLPIAFDGEFFLPLGRAKRTPDGRTEVLIERLPHPLSQGQRSLQGSIRIFFQKILSQKLGLAFDYPLLSVVTRQPDGEVSYSQDLSQAKVSQTNHILLITHDLLGETQRLAADLLSGVGRSPALTDPYDLILAFDYENIHTSVEENARLLKQRLEAIGLHANHGKTLHLVAHGLGGLICRWFIEREGGNEMVQHLVMAGTPNVGTPWSTVQAWATTALGIGLNSLSTAAWPVKVLGGLIAGIEAVDVTLDQMQPGSELLKSLEASADPGVPYTIIAGNQSIMPAALAASANGTSLLQRLLQKLVGNTANLVFFGQPNDLFASVHSMTRVGEGRSPAPVHLETNCDHFTYFRTKSVQELTLPIAKS